MRITSIKFNEKNGGGKPTENFLKELCSLIIHKMDKSGFITDAFCLNGSSIKVGLNRSSFRINTKMLGSNARISPFVKSQKGYKRTNVPNWNQRVEFNNILNTIFDSFGIEARIKSGCFTVRDKMKGAFTEDDWKNQTPSWMGHQGALKNGLGQEVCRIVTEIEAREELNSSQLEKEHAEKTRSIRLEKAKEYRNILRLFNNSKKVIISGFNNYGNKPTKNGKKVTHTSFFTMLSKLNSWEARRVKISSMKTTAQTMSLGF